jgi:hypothetical protein
MATVIDELIDGYVFCADQRCPNYNQKPYTVRRRKTSWSFMDSGGDLPGEEKAIFQVDFPLEDGQTPPDCDLCGERLVATDQERPVYARISGQDPMRILNLEQGTQVRELKMEGLESKAQVAEMRAAMAEMREEMFRLSRELQETSTPVVSTHQGGGDVTGAATVKRGPGRPRKESA